MVSDIDFFLRRVQTHCMLKSIFDTSMNYDQSIDLYTERREQQSRRSAFVRKILGDYTPSENAIIKLNELEAGKVEYQTLLNLTLGEIAVNGGGAFSDEYIKILYGRFRGVGVFGGDIFPIGENWEPKGWLESALNTGHFSNTSELNLDGILGFGISPINDDFVLGDHTENGYGEITLAFTNGTTSIEEIFKCSPTAEKSVENFQKLGTKFLHVLYEIQHGFYSDEVRVKEMKELKPFTETVIKFK